MEPLTLVPAGLAHDHKTREEIQGLLVQGSEVQSQRMSEKLTRTVALQRAQSAQETMICSVWYMIRLFKISEKEDLTLTAEEEYG